MNKNSALAQAESLLLAPFSLTEGDLSRTFGQILTHQVDYADLYFQYSRSEAWSLDEGIVKSGSFNIDQGVGVRAISGEKTAFAYSDDISSRALTDAATAVRAIAAAGQNGILPALKHGCLLYTSDAADERSSVDLGGRRIIKKKKQVLRYWMQLHKRTEYRDHEQIK